MFDTERWRNAAPGIYGVLIGLVILIPLFLVANRQFNKEIVHQEVVGNLVNAIVIPTSFNERQKMQITTDKGVYLIEGLGSFTKGEEIHITYWSNGDVWLSQWRGKGHFALIQ